MLGLAPQLQGIHGNQTLGTRCDPFLDVPRKKNTRTPWNTFPPFPIIFNLLARKWQSLVTPWVQRSRMPGGSIMYGQAWHVCILAAPGLKGPKGLQCVTVCQWTQWTLWSLAAWSLCASEGFSHGLHCDESAKELVPHDSCMVSWI